MHELDHLTVVLWSVAAMTPGRLERIGQVLDEHPMLRPELVGGDPPQIPVGESIAELLSRTGLPIEWTGGTATPRRDPSAWFIDLREQWTLGDGPTGDRVVRQSSDISIHLPPERVAQAGGPTAVLDGTAALADALGASFACAYPDALSAQLDRWYRESGAGRPDPRFGLATVHWWQYFGPAFVARHPGLMGLERSVLTPGGGVAHRATDAPETSLHPADHPTAGEWRLPLVDLLGEEAFSSGMWEGVAALPSEDEHAGHDPDSTPPPSDLLERVAAQEHARGELRSTQYARGSERRRQLESRRDPVGPIAGEAEWSTNVDGEDVPRILKALRAALGMEITAPYAGALCREIANAPEGVEGSVQMRTALGPVTLEWFADDIASIVLRVTGPDRAISAVEVALP